MAQLCSEVEQLYPEVAQLYTEVAQLYTEVAQLYTKVAQLYTKVTQLYPCCAIISWISIAAFHCVAFLFRRVQSPLTNCLFLSRVLLYT